VLTFNLRNSAMLATRDQIGNLHAFFTIVYLILIAGLYFGFPRWASKLYHNGLKILCNKNALLRHLK